MLLFFGKGEQVWKQLFPLLEASPECDGADGAARCLLCTAVTNRQTPPCFQDNRKAVTVCMAHTLEQMWGCPTQPHSCIFSSLAPWLCRAGGRSLPQRASSPTSHLGQSQTEVAVTLIAKGLVCVGGKRPRRACLIY